MNGTDPMTNYRWETASCYNGDDSLFCQSLACDADNYCNENPIQEFKKRSKKKRNSKKMKIPQHE